jgi:uncharacterized protein
MMMRQATLFFVAWVAAFAAAPAHAQPQFPERGTAPVVDAANIIDPATEAALTEKLDQFEQRNQRQFVVATVPDLQGYEISDYGYQLGRAWALGDKETNDGVILLVAPNERKVRIEVGYGLEPVLTDGLSSLIIQQQILPKFKDGDMPGGIVAGTDAIIRQLELPPEEAQAIAAQAQQQPESDREGCPIGFVIWGLFILFFVVLPMIARGARGRRYRRSGVAGAVGEVLLWTAINAAMNSGKGSGSSGWGGFSGGGGGGFGGGGFSGGGGSFGGGGASGSW